MGDEDTTPKSGGTPTTHTVFVGHTWYEDEDPHYAGPHTATPESTDSSEADGALVSPERKPDQYSGEYGSAEVSAGTLYYSRELKSGLSYDVDKKEGELDVVKAAVTVSALHAEGTGKLDLGAMLGDASSWLAGLVGIAPAAQPQATSSGADGLGGGGPMAARVSDPTAHGSPLAPGIGSPNVFIGGLPAWRAAADFHACPIVKGLVPDIGGMVALGSPTVFINNLMACRMGDMVVEIPGGPNPIVSGCPTVMIGAAGKGSGGTDGGAASSASSQNQNPLALDGKAKVDVATATAELVVAATLKNGKPLATAKVGVMVAAVKGSVEGGLTIPLWGTHSIRLGGGLEGSLASAGAEAGGEAGYSDSEGWHLDGDAKAGVGIGGVGVSFSIGFK